MAVHEDNRQTIVSKEGIQVNAQATLRATMLIEALSADPVSLALKSGVRKKPASPMFKKPSKAEEEVDTEGTGGGRGGGGG
jgi:hypothetical protein